MLKNIVCMAAMAAMVGSAFAAEWMTDFEAAKAKAAQENKHLLLDFTGSDWCTFCIQLRNKVFDTPEFEAYAADKFVLVEIDQPQNPAKLSAELQQQNRSLCEKYNVRGFPTVMVMTPGEQVVGGFTGGRMDVPSVQQELDTALATSEQMKKADAAEGAEKARALTEAYKAMPEKFREFSGLREKAAEADPDNTTGIQDIIKEEDQAKEIELKLLTASAAGDAKLTLKAVNECLETALPANRERLLQVRDNLENVMLFQEITAMKSEPLKAIAFIDEKLPTAQGNTKVLLLATKLEFMVNTASTIEEIMAAKPTADALKEATPHQSLKDKIEKDFADPEDLLRRVIEERMLGESGL